MKAINVVKYGRFPQIIQLPLPTLTKDNFLIKMKYAPINPSDINFFQGYYGIRKQGTPIVGFQGSGVIQDCENKSFSNLIGRNVSVLANKNNGTFSTHIVSSQKQLIIWPQKYQLPLKLQKLATMWINPVSCIGLASYIQKQNAQTIVISAATSQLSKMLVRYISKKYPSKRIIGFSRFDKQDQYLKSFGFSQLLRISDSQSIQKMRDKYSKCLFLDCIGGQFASKLFNNLPANSSMISYGRLSKQPLNNVDLGELYFKNKKISGFWMNTFLNQISVEDLKNLKGQIIENGQQIFDQKVRMVYPLENYMDAIRQSVKNPSQGKTLLAL